MDIKSTMKLTRKIQLLIDLPKEERTAAWITLYNWQNYSYRAANLIVSHLYIQERMKDFLYLSEGIRYKLADIAKDKEGMLICSKRHTTYKVGSKHFKGKLPTNIINNINQEVSKRFNTHKLEYWKGERSLMNFKKDMAIPFDSKGIFDLKYNPERKAFSFRLFSIPMITYLGRDFYNTRSLLEHYIAGKTKLCGSHIQLKNAKIFMLGVFEIEKEKHKLKPEIIAEASLSLEYLVTVKAGRQKLKIGTREEFLYRRLAIQTARKRVQEGVKYCKSGKGRKRKLKALSRFHEQEKNYINNRLHVYSRKLIDFCVKYQAGTLILLNQENKIEVAKKEAFVLRNWGYYDLITKIKYKAEMAGIELIID